MGKGEGGVSGSGRVGFEERRPGESVKAFNERVSKTANDRLIAKAKAATRSTEKRNAYMQKKKEKKRLKKNGGVDPDVPYRHGAWPKPGEDDNDGATQGNTKKKSRGGGGGAKQLPFAKPAPTATSAQQRTTMARASDFQELKDYVRFGEVAMAPPSFNSAPRGMQAKELSG